MSQEFIIVIKAPKNKLQSRIVSFIDIQLANDDILPQKEKHVNHKNDKVVLKEQTELNQIDILLLGYLDNPKIKCMKQLFNKATGAELVSLAVKKN